MEELLASVEELPPGLRPPLLEAIVHRFRARLAGGDSAAEDEFRAAAEQLRALELPFHLAVVLLEQAEWLSSQGRAEEAQPLLTEARETFDRREAKPWLERVEAAAASRTA